MARQLEGILHITGSHDTGKTTFALECGASPDKIAFFDDDVKGRATVDDLKKAKVEFGAYYDLAELGKKCTLLNLHEKIMNVINDIKPGQFDAIIWDTWTRFAKTCRYYVQAHPNEFRNPNEWAAQGRIKGAEMNQEGTLYEARIASDLARLTRTVVLVTHLKDQYLNNVKTEKKIPACSKTLARIARFRLWLRQNPNGSPVPVGLFLKRFDRKEATDEGLRTVCVVPRKITPQLEERSLWDTIWRYWETPVGNRPPLADEIPNEYELSILDGTLTPDQKHTLNLMLEAGVVESQSDVEEAPITPVVTPAPELPKEDPVIVMTLELAGQNLSYADIAKKLREAGTVRPIPWVKDIMQKYGGKG